MSVPDHSEHLHNIIFIAPENRGYFFLPLTKSFTLGKDERLKSRKKIDQLFKTGKSFSMYPFKVFYVLSKKETGDNVLKQQSSLQFGIGVGTKNFKKAVDRNRVKRLAREAYRLQKNQIRDQLKGTMHRLDLFFISTGKEIPTFETVKNKTGLVLSRISKMLDENISSNS